MDRPIAIAEGVELFPARTPTLAPATHTNSYALGGAQVLLVEPATPHSDEREAWLAWAGTLIKEGRSLVAIVLTHHHSDHVGGAQYFAKELNLPLWAHRETAARLPHLKIERHLEEGDELLSGTDAWRVLHTPGHAPGHICLWNEFVRCAVVGDMVASVGTILIEPKDGDMAVYIQQLARLAQFDANVALPAHGGPIRSPEELFRRYIGHRMKREAKVLSALQRERSTLGELVSIAYADIPSTLWPLAQLSLEAHLIKLEREGRAIRQSDRWSL